MNQPIPTPAATPTPEPTPRGPFVPPTPVVIGLTVLIAVLAAVAAAAGLLWPGGAGPLVVETIRGEMVTLHGRGLYRYDSLFTAGGARGTDTLTLLVGLPLLGIALWRYRRGSLRGALLLVGALGYVLYVYASLALGAVAYNPLFLVYVVLFAASLWTFGLVFVQVRGRLHGARLAPALPRRRLGGFLIGSGLVTLVVWGGPLLEALVRGGVPARMAPRTTPVTEALDLATITPATILAGVFVLRRRMLGVLVAAALLVLEVLLAPMIALQTAYQLTAGVTLAPGEVVGPVAGFVVLGVLALWALRTVLRSVEGQEAGTQTRASESRGLSVA